MFDELFEMFDRDKKGQRNGSRPGLLGRLFGGGDDRDDDDDRRGRRGRYEADDDVEFGRERDRGRRRRDNGFGFDD